MVIRLVVICALALGVVGLNAGHPAYAGGAGGTTTAGSNVSRNANTNPKPATASTVTQPMSGGGSTTPGSNVSRNACTTPGGCR